MQKGHFLYYPNGQQANEVRIKLPFKLHIVDGGLLEQVSGQVHGKCQISYINGWTILGMWDRSLDSRGNSSSSFLFRGIHQLDDAIKLAIEHYPEIWERIKPVL